MEKRFMKGCEALAEAAVRGGVRFFAGYPITPQNEIPEYLSWRLPQVGGTFVQGESEIASINMVYGAATTGFRAMTSSSGPGISLKTEGISYLAAAKLPALIVDVSRGGPGLGSIQPAQSDYLQATKALGHGGHRLIVFAPSTVQEIVDITYNVFEYAERDRNPVFILIDGCLGAMMESVELPPMKEVDPRSQSSWTLGRWPGEKRAPHLISPIYEAGLEGLNKSFAKRIETWKQEDTQVEELYLDDADYVITAYGIAARIARQVVEDMREEGCKIGMIRPITLFPFPEKSFDKLDYSRLKGIINIEMTIPAQMVEDVQRSVRGRAPIFEHGHSGGVLLDEYDIRTAILDIIGKEADHE
ncbi:MAG: 3-methyl-2-oxobutanoate dehydrogenase subunit VorB [Parasporobacterium sp.]|nr:3-methyl-2-oxobutanoate dehydrogenase subunit VorB [Parasporobacterium sp.]